MNTRPNPETVDFDYIKSLVGEKAAQEFTYYWYELTYGKEPVSISKMAALMFCAGYVAKLNEEEI